MGPCTTELATLLQEAPYSVVCPRLAEISCSRQGNSEFEKSNKILNAVLKAKKKNGDEPAVEHKDAVSETDWKTIMNHFKDVETTDNPVHLTR